MSKHYKLRCLGNGDLLEDEWQDGNVGDVFGHLLANPNYEGEALLRSEYISPLKIDRNTKNIFKYSWLPVQDQFDCDTGPVTFEAKEIAKSLGLKNLFCAFSGYNPKLGAYNRTGTFKEYEAAGVLGRHGLNNKATVVLASAGNTARGFVELGSSLDIPIIIVVPEESLSEIWTSVQKIGDNISLYGVSNADYADAIHIANVIASFPGHVVEGGVKNVGRRDGMGTAFLCAYDYIGSIPDHYFQSVGSASGPLSAWEASMRLQAADSESPEYPVLHMSQNAPFTPIVDSWQQNSPTLLPIDEEQAKQQIEEINAKVLSNRKPPYSIKGGVYQAMTASNGKAYSVSNEEARRACDMFLEKENILLGKASSVTFASLLQAVEQKTIAAEDCVLMHITGAGKDLIDKDLDIQSVPVKAIIPAQASKEEIAKIINK